MKRKLKLKIYLLFLLGISILIHLGFKSVRINQVQLHNIEALYSGGEGVHAPWCLPDDGFCIYYHSTGDIHVDVGILSTKH